MSFRHQKFIVMGTELLQSATEVAYTRFAIARVGGLIVLVTCETSLAFQISLGLDRRGLRPAQSARRLSRREGESVAGRDSYR
jgi:hypothetical protein